MPVIAKQIAGILNTDDSNVNLHPTHHKMARNVVFRGMDGNYRVQSCVGNRNVDFTLPAYDNQCIGSFYDQLKQRVFFFNYNSYGFHGIYMYDRIADTVTKVLLNFTDSQEDLFDFSLDYPIPSVNILYRTEEDGDLLVWTDRNNRPQCLNIKHALAGQYGTNWKAEYLTVAKKMPLIAPVCDYEDDSTVTINNLRKKLYQFRYRWVYRNLEKSTWSPYSKVPTPLDPDSLATDIDPLKNNRIDVTIETGANDVVKIELALRICTGVTFSDDLLVVTLDKSTLGIQDDTTYTYYFYNDSSYPGLDTAESLLLFDYVPKKANTQELLNGNVIIYGGVTEGYSFGETLDVESSVEIVEADTDALTVSTFQFLEPTSPSDSDIFVYLTFAGTPQTGDVVHLLFEMLNSPFTQYPITYTVTVGQTLTDVITSVEAAINTALSGTGWGTGGGGGSYPPPPNSIVCNNSDENWASPSNSNYVTYATPGDTIVDDISNSCYHPMSKYRFGLVYFDEYGVTNGVVTNDNFIIETLETNTTGATEPDISAITFEINHQPPEWAKYFSFVRTANLTMSNFLCLVTADTEKDSDYGYLNITNIQENQNGTPVYGFTEGDRIRIIGQYNQAVTTVYDFPISGLIEDPVVGGVSKTGFWVKVPYNAVLSSFGSVDKYMVEIYTPAQNNSANQLLYYEFGETYEVLNPGESNRYHQGKVQDQTASLPAIYTFLRGDCYLRQRNAPTQVDLAVNDTYWVFDPSVSDKFPSRITSNGRTFIVDEFAAEKYFPTVVRYSEAYQQNTNINQTNRFYPLSFDEYDRARGDIQRLKVRGTNMRVFQSRGVGVVGVYREMLTNADGSSNLIQNSQIINTINYYSEAFGMGNEYCSLASGSTVDYFCDPILGNQIRVSGDGMTNLTELYKGQFYISSLISPYAKTWYREDGSKAKIIGCYDFSEEEFLTVLQAGERSLGEISPYTFTFNEKRNAYSSFFDYSPEWVCSVQDKILSWKNGQLWVHDEGYANFYGAGVDPSITLVFGDPIAVKKNFLAISYQANEAWTSATTGDVITSYINPQTNIQQQSQLKSVDYEDIEGKWCSAFLFDAYSRSSAAVGLVDGDSLTGFWLQIKLTYSSDGEAWLYMPAITYNPNNRNY